ncbi:hypothetical protein NIES2111_57730 (plasmid) [Nostoc sp. NIES-2111]|nr:hypothetical protein NIES2111_57730 [Nostoc sp. NIES-2111]
MGLMLVGMAGFLVGFLGAALETIYKVNLK